MARFVLPVPCMTQPRFVVPGDTLMITRRTLRRHHLFRPDSAIRQLYLYALALCAPTGKPSGGGARDFAMWCSRRGLGACARCTAWSFGTNAGLSGRNGLAAPGLGRRTPVSDDTTSDHANALRAEFRLLRGAVGAARLLCPRSRQVVCALGEPLVRRSHKSTSVGLLRSIQLSYASLFIFY